MIPIKISPIQLFTLMVLFEIGTSIVVGVGFEAGQDAWIAILLGTAGGLVIFSMYIYLYSRFPDVPLTSYLEKILGKIAGRILAVIYISYFLYLAARVLRDFADLITTTILYETPPLAIVIMSMVTIIFASYLGFEVIARTSEIFFPWVMLFGILFTLFIMMTGTPKFENMLPVLENGWVPVLKTAFPTIVFFPFGEIIIFTLFFPLVNNIRHGILAGYSALLFSAFILLIVSMLIISVLGPFLAKISTIPLLVTVGKGSVGDFLQRLDAIALILMCIGGFFKCTIFFYGAVEGFSNLIKKPELNKYTIPVMAITVIFMSFLIADNYFQHLFIGLKVIPLYFDLPLFMVIPLILVFIVIIKKKVAKKNQL
ncbi:GerAB/ArcD/ProY family transporter [Bacillaceae bacterium Marseille-Q3522]|nr:GerAB/ArcD/ProY family transporter [Bacillaceae bacterium Marseille-Q3522]